LLIARFGDPNDRSPEEGFAMKRPQRRWMARMLSEATKPAARLPWQRNDRIAKAKSHTPHEKGADQD
jgi:hypothetical protein